MTAKHLPPGTRQLLLSFDIDEPSRTLSRHAGANVWLTQQVFRPFYPRGLWLWGTTKETFVHRVMVGNMSEIESSSSRIPGRYFESSVSFDRLMALAEQGELEDVALPRQVFADMETAHPGMMVGVNISGPFEQIALWGLTYKGHGPIKRADVVAAGDEWQARIVALALGGEDLLAEATGPSPEIVTRLALALADVKERR